jgi:hypothetical protein
MPESPVQFGAQQASGFDSVSEWLIEHASPAIYLLQEGWPQLQLPEVFPFLQASEQ